MDNRSVSILNLKGVFYMVICMYCNRVYKDERSYDEDCNTYNGTQYHNCIPEDHELIIAQKMHDIQMELLNGVDK